MKIGIIGCSHSAGVSAKKLLQKTGGFDVMRGYPREWAKLYPEHEFHLFGAPGGGQNNQEAAIRTCLKQNIDIVFLQFTTQRQLFPVDLESGGINDTWALRKQEDNFFHYAQRFHSFSVKNYVMERKCVMVGPHWPKDKQMPIKGLDWKYREGTGPILNLLKDNGYFNEMAGSWYSIRSFGKRLFPKGFFTILWVPTYEYGPTDKNDSSVVIDGVKVPEFMQDFLTGHNVSKYTDYPSTVYDWMIQNYQDDLNIDRDLAIKLVYKDYKDHKGHLGEENQRKVLMNYILSNNELTSALEGN